MRLDSSVSPSSSLICVGIISGAHGTHGAVYIRSFTEDVLGISSHDRLRDESGRIFAITSAKLSSKGRIIAVLRGVTDRDSAESLRGTHLYVDRDILPPLEDESWYYVDLIGLMAETQSGEILGDVTWVHDFGSGEDLLEITPRNGNPSFFIPFTRDYVPVVDVAGGRVVVIPLEMTEKRQ